MTHSNANEALIKKLLYKTGRAFFFSAKLLPEKVRYPISIGYLLGRAADTIADDIDLPSDVKVAILDKLLVMIKQKNATRIEETLKPVLDLLPTSSELTPLLLCLDKVIYAYAQLDQASQTALEKNLITIINAQRKENLFFSQHNLRCLETAEQLDYYLYAFSSSVAICWTEISANFYPDLSNLPKEELLQNAISFGKGMQLLNILKDLPQDFSQKRCYLPLEYLRQKNIDPNSTIENPTTLQPLVKELWQQAVNYYKQGWLYMVSLKPYRLRLASAATLLMSFAMLEKIKDTRYLETETPVKINHFYTALNLLLAAIVSLSPLRFSSIIKLTSYKHYLS